MTDLTEATLESVLSAAEALKAVRCFIGAYSNISLKLIFILRNLQNIVLIANNNGALSSNRYRRLGIRRLLLNNCHIFLIPSSPILSRKNSTCHNITHLTIGPSRCLVFRLERRRAKRVHLAFDGHNQEPVDLKILGLRLGRELSG